MYINANYEFLVETKKKGFLLLTGLVKINSYNYKKNILLQVNIIYKIHFKNIKREDSFILTLQNYLDGYHRCCLSYLQIYLCIFVF